MRIARMFALAAVSIALPLGPSARAEPRIGIEGWGGWNRHSMFDVNDTLRTFNGEYGTALAPIRGGGSWGFGVRLWPREDVLVRLGFERLSARSQDSGVRFDLGAYALTLGVTRFFPVLDRLRCGIGLGVGPLLTSGGLDARGAALQTSGAGFGGHVTGETLIPIGRAGSLNGVVGYRWGSVDKLKLGENTSDLRAQYSGFFVRAGLALERPRD